MAGKADEVVEVRVPFEVGPSVDGIPGATKMTFRTWGQLRVTTDQDRERSWERLQLVAQDGEYRRRSWRGRSPYVTVSASRAEGGVEYTLTVLNWGDVTAYGALNVATEPPPEAGIEVVHNSPDCHGCDDPAGELRDAIVGVIQGAEESIEVAVYGLDDPTIIDALCNASEDGVDVTLVTDETSEDAEDSRSYYDAFSGEAGLVSCGARVDFVRSYGLMHHKFVVVDRDSDSPVLLTGSTNFTRAGLEENHNHVVIIRGVPELIDRYTGELGQFYRHCATERLEERSRCSECSPACTEDRSPNGAVALPGGSSVEALFAPRDDALRALRGEASSVRRNDPDPACNAPGADCVCRVSGSRYVCEYCAQGEDGYGLLDEARERIWMTMYSATDSCFALGVVRAAERGVSVRTVWDFVKSGSKYSRDDYLCGAGIETWITNWGNGSAQVRNHNKSIVVDDVLFTGSMNLSASGAAENNENTLIIRDDATADSFATFIGEEIELLQELGVAQRDPAECLCNDIVDNDGDGLIDEDDADCDAGDQ
jgi:phosphatidylserine/phosphatidylglycerophosphate/cardiolipin synthase-like enzyme